MKKDVAKKIIVITILMFCLGACVVPIISAHTEIAAQPTMNVKAADFKPLSNNLFAYWDFNEGSGTTIHDKSGNGHDGINNGAIWAIGVIGSALYFDGSDYVSFPNSVLTQPPYSICAWVKPDSLSDGVDHYIIANGGETSLSNGFFMNIEWKSGYHGDYNFGAKVPSTFSGHTTYHPQSSDWTFLCGTWDGIADATHIKLYMNGINVGNSVSATPNAGSSANLEIGVSSLLNYFYKGLIDEVRIYNKTLSDQEVVYLNNILKTSVSAGQGINLNITNVGPTNAINVNWHITVKGGLFGHINIDKNSVISTLYPGESAHVGTGAFFGLGKIQVTVQVDDDTTTMKGTQFLVFTKVS